MPQNSTSAAPNTKCLQTLNYSKTSQKVLVVKYS